MADIPPAGAVSQAAPVAASSGNNIVVETAVNSTPDKIAQLARQIEVSGTLAQAPAGNTVTLNTVIGPLVLLLPQIAQSQQDKLQQQLLALFQNQKPLTVILQPGNPPAQAFLLLPPNTGASQSAVNPTPSLGNILPGNASTFLSNTILPAVVLPNDITFPSVTGQAGQVSYANLNPNAIPADAALNLAGGVPLIETLEKTIADAAFARLQGQTQPNFSLPQGSQAIPNSDPPVTSSGLPGLSQASGGTALLQPGAELALRINAVFPPAAQGTPSPIPQGNQILAMVTGSGPEGQLILKAGDATLFVRQPVDVPVGTQLLITVEPAQTGDAPAILAMPDCLTFSSLQQIFAALGQIDPAAARAVLAGRMPQPGDGMAGAVLFFLSAVRQGDVRSWLGNGAVDLLSRAGKVELIGKLIQDMQQAAQTVRDPVVGEWKSYPVPVNANGQFGIVHFYVHNERQNHGSQQGAKEGKAAPSQIRFLIDVRMSRLGPLQLDGFLRPKQLDIIVRSENRLPQGTGQELRQTFTNSLEAIGYNGGLNFQFGRQGWLSPQNPAASAAVVT